MDKKCGVYTFTRSAVSKDRIGSFSCESFKGQHVLNMVLGIMCIV